jgi:hypothetical protein
VGACLDIHERERALELKLALAIIRFLHRREGGEEVEGAVELEWGLIGARVRVTNTPIQISLMIEP